MSAGTKEFEGLTLFRNVSCEGVETVLDRVAH
jgi:hypothetical protein